MSQKANTVRMPDDLFNTMITVAEKACTASAIPTAPMDSSLGKIMAASAEKGGDHGE